MLTIIPPTLHVKEERPLKSSAARVVYRKTGAKGDISPLITSKKTKT